MTLRRKLAWIAVLYFAQGFPFGIAYKVWPVYFRLHGVSLAEIGLMSLLFLPYTLKTAWAPLVDRFGTRQRWVAGAEVALAGVTLVLLGLDPSHPGPALWAVLMAFTLASATQDVAIDAYAVDVATEHDRGPINGVRITAYRVAMVASGGLVLVVADRLGWRTIWGVSAIAFLLLAGAALLSPRAPRERPTGAILRGAGPRLRAYRAVSTGAATLLAAGGMLAGWGPYWIAGTAVAFTLAMASFLDPALLSWVGRWEMAPVLLFTLLYKLGDSTLERMVEPFWVDRGLSPTAIGLVSVTLGTMLTATGAIVGGWAISRRGLYPALLWFGLGQLLSNLGYAAVAFFDLPRQSIYGASMLESLTQGLGTAAFLSFLMALCDRRHGATQFALLTAVFALSRDLAGAFSGLGAEALGYPAYFAATALVALPGLALLPWLRPLIPPEETVPAPHGGQP